MTIQNTYSKSSRQVHENRGPRTEKDAVKSNAPSFRDLLVWQKSFALVKVVYGWTRSFPREELYGLTSQIRRCCISIPSNVAEGYRRWHQAEFKQHLNISIGSSAELETQLRLAHEIGYLQIQDLEQGLKEIDVITKMLVGLARKI